MSSDSLIISFDTPVPQPLSWNISLPKFSFTFVNPFSGLNRTVSTNSSESALLLGVAGIALGFAAAWWMKPTKRKVYYRSVPNNKLENARLKILNVKTNAELEQAIAHLEKVSQNKLSPVDHQLINLKQAELQLDEFLDPPINDDSFDDGDLFPVAAAETPSPQPSVSFLERLIGQFIHEKANAEQRKEEAQEIRQAYEGMQRGYAALEQARDNLVKASNKSEIRIALRQLLNFYGDDDICQLDFYLYQKFSPQLQQ